jgi:hypothetical protein
MKTFDGTGQFKYSTSNLPGFQIPYIKARLRFFLKTHSDFEIPVLSSVSYWLIALLVRPPPPPPPIENMWNFQW